MNLGKILLFSGLGLGGYFLFTANKGQETQEPLLGSESFNSGFGSGETMMNKETPGVTVNIEATKNPFTNETMASAPQNNTPQASAPATKKSSSSAPISTSYGTAFVDPATNKVIGGYDNKALMSFIGPNAPSTKKAESTSSSSLMSKAPAVSTPVIKQDPLKDSLNSFGIKSPMQFASTGFTKKSTKVI